jgi:hypothetical protein
LNDPKENRDVFGLEGVRLGTLVALEDSPASSSPGERRFRQKKKIAARMSKMNNSPPTTMPAIAPGPREVLVETSVVVGVEVEGLVVDVVDTDSVVVGVVVVTGSALGREVSCAVDK